MAVCVGVLPTFMPILFVILLTVVLCVLGTLMLLAMRDRIMIAHASARWPVVEGTLKSATPLRAGNLDEGGGNTFMVYLRYHYTVGGQTYWGDWKTSPRRLKADMEDATELPAGTSLNVYYDPANPKRSTLEPGWVLRKDLPTFAAAFFLFLGIVFLVIMSANALIF